jgi:hypothetical protein
MAESTNCEFNLDALVPVDHPEDELREILKWKSPTPNPKPKPKSSGIEIRDAALAPPKIPPPIVISSDEDFDPSQIPPEPEKTYSSSSSESEEEEQYVSPYPIKLEAIDDLALLKAMGIKPDPEYEAKLRREGHGIMDRADKAMREMEQYLDEQDKKEAEKENMPNNAAMVQLIENQCNNNKENEKAFDPNKPGPSSQCLIPDPTPVLLKKTPKKRPVRRKTSANKPRTQNLRRHVLQKGLKNRNQDPKSIN